MLLHCRYCSVEVCVFTFSYCLYFYLHILLVLYCSRVFFWRGTSLSITVSSCVTSGIGLSPCPVIISRASFEMELFRSSMPSTRMLCVVSSWSMSDHFCDVCLLIFPCPSLRSVFVVYVLFLGSGKVCSSFVLCPWLPHCGRPLFQVVCLCLAVCSL